MSCRRNQKLTSRKHPTTQKISDSLLLVVWIHQWLRGGHNESTDRWVSPRQRSSFWAELWAHDLTRFIGIAHHSGDMWGHLYDHILSYAYITVGYTVLGCIRLIDGRAQNPVILKYDKQMTNHDYHSNLLLSTSGEPPSLTLYII